MEKHKRITHLGLKPYSCDLCHESFGEEYRVAMHKRQHHSKDKPFQCSKCAKTFKSTVLLEHHIARIHDLRNCETCPHCEKIFSRLKVQLTTCGLRGLERRTYESMRKKSFRLTKI